jgi:ABC-type dipeptide/oligopeptide/nickel transport system ATPase subunit
VPLLIGLTGPSGGGKTYSALRLATGIQTVTGGDIYFIDTESRRALHYADQFKFKHVPFDAPFGSLDYLAALQFCVKQGAKVVVVDSMSHEHEGPGGMVDLHDQIALRMSGGDAAKLERVKMLAWSEPKQKRRQLINGILQLNANFIFCFRAKNTSKPIKGKNGRTEVEAMGFMPIAGEEFVFEQTLNALLMPGAGGVPTWFSEQIGERTMIKLPEQFKFLADRHTPLDEKIGASLARWAAGKERTKKEEAEAVTREFDAFDVGTEPEPALDPFGLEPIADGTAKGKQKAEEWTEGYLSSVDDCATIEDLMALQAKSANALAKLKTEKPELHEQAVEAGVKRAAELQNATAEEPFDA